MSWPKIELPQALKPVAKMVIHVSGGAILFALILLIEVLLSGFIRGLELIPFAPKWFEAAADMVEQALFGFDVLTGGLFLASELIKLALGMVKEIRNG